MWGLVHMLLQAMCILIAFGLPYCIDRAIIKCKSFFLKVLFKQMVFNFLGGKTTARSLFCRGIKSSLLIFFDSSLCRHLNLCVELCVMTNTMAFHLFWYLKQILGLKFQLNFAYSVQNIY